MATGTASTGKPATAKSAKAQPDTKEPEQPPKENPIEKRFKVIEYAPLGSNEAIQLNIDLVRRMLCYPTKSGKYPSDVDVIKFMMLCKGSRLDPWAGDAFLTGYDSNDGPSFSLITSVSALLKRAELNEQFDGVRNGIVILQKDGTLFQRRGTIRLEGEKLIGGWAVVKRKDRRFTFESALEFAVYNTGRSRWSKDPTGMIAKCAKAAALRDAFPMQLGGLYAREEMDALQIREQTTKISTIEDLKEKLGKEQPGITQSDEAAKFQVQNYMGQIRELKDIDTAIALAQRIREDDAVSGEQCDFLLYHIDNFKDSFPEVDAE